MKRLVLIDGNALLHRAYHATPPLSTSQGELVNAVYGFTSMLFKAWDEFKPDYLAVAWDVKAPTFRHGHYEDYKATRKVMDDGLANQFKRTYEILEAFSIPQFKLPGFEADDLVGTLAKQAAKAEKVLEIIIVTGDRDIMQLIGKQIKVFMPKKTLLDVGMYGEEEFAARFGFEPENLVDYKGLAGDASDNIPGVPGIGEVTATKLIQKYATIEKVYRHLEEFPERLKKLLEEGKESAFLSKKLATLDTKAPIELNLKACQVHDFDREKVKKLFEELEFRSLIPRIPGVEENITSVIPAKVGIQLNESSSKLDPRLRGDDKTSDLDKQVEPILKKMSQVGVLVDLDFLSRFGKDLKDKLAYNEQQIYSIIGHQLNLNSPKQLSTVLFDELNLPVIKKTKTGRSTNEETLQELRNHHPVVPFILEYRKLFKLISTYVDALPKSVGEDGRIHSTFNVEGAATGRITSDHPNLQNIPVRGELGGEIRKAFIAPKGKILLGVDYSQIELRILAHLADDQALKKAFSENVDIHTATASKIFKVPLDKVTKEQRMVGKTMNFATLYGQGAHALSRQLGVDYHIARDYIEEYFAQFPKVRSWMNKVLEEAWEKGYSETLWGRKRYFPELKSTNRMMQAFGERAAVNHPVQGTAADMIKKAMVEIDRELESRIKNHESRKVIASAAKQSRCLMILQIHDELLFECDPEEVESTAKMVKEKMENALKLSVPVVAEIKSGPNWGEMKALYH